MALKDLIADKGALDEATIERIVHQYVRYDVENQEVTFLSPFASLSNKAKILVYLAALQGWKFVTEEPVANDARPADIEAATGIPGGSLRPTLRELREGHVLSERESRYSVRAVSLSVIEAEIEDAAVRPIRSYRRKAARAPQRQAADKEVTEAAAASDNATGRATPKRRVTAKTGSIGATFEKWIDEGYFNEPRTLTDVQQRFRKEAMLVPQTSLPGYFLGAVRKGRLTREEVSTGGRTVWAYTTKASN